MFVYNLKINGSKVFKTFFIVVILLIICIMGIVLFRIFNGANKASTCMPNSYIYEISAKNYTNVLKTVHENIDNYVGMKIKFTGYVYRVSDLTENQFVLARDMIVSSNSSQYLVVGFLCEYEKAKDYSDDTWVTITGEITKGDYHGDMPILKIIDISESEKPSEEYVYPPDESYIPTSVIL